MLHLSFRPRLVDSIKGYNAERFIADLGAGITVGLVALPLAMAFAVASGVKPEAGIFTAIIAGLIVSAFGGSRVQIGGPAGAFIVVIYGIIQQYGLANLFIATMMAGTMLLVLGLCGVGSFIRFIPVAIVFGFTTGIAVIIALSQVRDFLGLAIDNLPADFFSQVATLARHADTLNWTAVALGVASLGVIILWPRFVALLRGSLPRDLGGVHTAASSAPAASSPASSSPASSSPLPGLADRHLAFLSRLPGTVVALAIATAAAMALDLPVETIGSRFGGIPQSLPALALPAFDWASLHGLVAPAITIALLGALESLLCARVADGMTGDRHDPNQELIAQGIANLVTPLFGGLPATGTIARTTTNVRAGATSPVAGIIHALTLLAIVLAAAPLAKNIPLAALAAILLFVAWNMGEWGEFRRLPQFSPPYRIVLVATFLLTVVFSVTVAVEVGLVLAALFFIYRVSNLTRVEPIELEHPQGGALLAMHAAADGRDSRRIAAYSLFGSLFFGTVGKIEALLDHSRENIAVVILEMHQVISLDTTGLDALASLHAVLESEGRQLVLAGLNRQPMSLLVRSGFRDELGVANVVPGLSQAVARATALLAVADGNSPAAPAPAQP